MGTMARLLEKYQTEIVQKMMERFFKLRSGNRVGCMVTLRRKRMYEFLDRLINITMPRIRDFRGLSLRAFDKAGNYSLGLQDQYVFPEIDVDKIDWSQGMNINIVIENSSKDESIELLKFLGMPFKRD
jgi:large subunit ribosomal protein L5